ncbi:FeoB-associated Cys-rich membrane protein [Coraliomargarita sp. SDUM461004]|uniref:FeoB-associated Cys-rich membrane protein n=1 Tax=Thalassobacterium sedimentorum TaxID=3041258 RepID=A0ABU1AEM9_9BACT|nr:FeoB-associated Cys-rich membrane protein [Coraliomargarita sp. SDUM461004]MDQ8193109.1 FeoB-associated Cys-rich membrane protein [Coraliomargarita sp. SDUM461004]
MERIEIILVAIIILGALLYLYKTFKPKGKNGGGCGCGTVDCKVPKPNIQTPKKPNK